MNGDPSNLKDSLPLVTEREGEEMFDTDGQPDEPEGVTVDEPTEPALNPKDDDLNEPPVDGPSGEGRDGPGDTSQGTPGGEESPESAD